MDRLTCTEGKDVVTVDDYGAIRRAYRDGMSIRQIARQLGHSRRTVRHALTHSDPHPEPLTRNRSAPRLGPFQALIEQILLDDENAPPKQRHTAAQIHRRLRDEQGYLGGYAQVQRYVRKHRRRHEETFIPLGHLPGQRLEADFGHIHVDFPDGRKLVPFLVTTWAYSNAPFVLALPFERTEAILEGMVKTFEFFGAVAKEVWWDNPKTVATLILLGRQRQCHPRYAALASHYVFEPRFCMPRRGNEKPDAESTVKAVQKRFATPVPRVADLNELNTFFRNRCEAERQRVVQSLCGPFLIKDRLAEDLAAASPLPRHRFDPCVIRPAVAVDKYQTVAFDGCRYSVPRSFAFQTVSVKGYVDRIVIAAQGQVVATHNRCFRKHTMILDPIHYLVTLGRKPAALDHAPVFRDWNLPACFADFRVELERSHGALSGSRRFVRILQLLGEHPMGRVSRAIEECASAQVWSAEAVIQRTRSLATVEAATRGAGASTADVPAIPQVHVPRPDLGCYDQLLSGSAAEGPVSVFFA
ncbi:MAG TPA: IS21 family transposase [Isosphaeraceae bacterium]|nr:IS21 family transposase [Isosphaeraceae bacterium]